MAPTPWTRRSKRCAATSGRSPASPKERGLFPRETISSAYELEYGQNSLGIHADSIPEGARVLDVDGVLATGGTARAMCQLVQNAGGRRLI